MAPKLFAVSYVVDLVVLAETGDEALKIAHSNLEEAASLIDVNEWERVYVVQPDCLEPDYLPGGWTENGIPYSKDNNTDRTIGEILEDQKKNA